MTTFRLNSISFKFEKDNLEQNLNNLLYEFQQTKPNSISLAPELCLSGYCYDNLEFASKFSEFAFFKIKKETKDKALGLTLIIKENEKFYNRFLFISGEKIIYSQDKYKLFKLGNEDKYFEKGSFENIKIFDFNGLKIAVLICFELRFSKLWDKVLGSDIILVPAFWSKKRIKHFKILLKALSISNQAFVISSNHDNIYRKIITPSKTYYKSKELELKQLQTLRKYINIGLSCKKIS